MCWADCAAVTTQSCLEQPHARTWRLAGRPTSRSPLSVKATTEGVVRWPSAFSITLAVLPCRQKRHQRQGRMWALGATAGRLM